MKFHYLKKEKKLKIIAHNIRVVGWMMDDWPVCERQCGAP